MGFQTCLIIWNKFQLDSRSRACKKVNVKVILTGFRSIGGQSHAVRSKQRSTYDEHSIKSNSNN